MFQNSSVLSKLYNHSEVTGIVTTSGPLQNPFVRIQLKIFLNAPDVMIAEKMALVFLNNLQPKEEYRLLTENLAVNLTSIKFSGILFSRYFFFIFLHFMSRLIIISFYQ